MPYPRNGFVERDLAGQNAHQVDSIYVGRQHLVLSHIWDVASC